MKKAISFVAVLVAITIAASSCGDKNKEEPRVPVTKVTLNKAELTIEAGGTATLKAKVVPYEATNKTVTWSSDKPAVATVDAKTGKITGVAPGTATITAAAGSHTAICTVTVAEAGRLITISRFRCFGSETELTEYAEFILDKEIDLTRDNITLDAGDTGARIESFGSYGDKASYLMFIEGVKTTGTVTFTFQKNGYVFYPSSYTATAWYVPPTLVTGVTLDRTTLTLMAGKEDILRPTLAPDDASNKSVTWDSDQPLIAEVDVNGVVKGLKEGTAVITATTVDGGHKASCTVTVTVNPEMVSGVSLNETTLTIKVGDINESLVATVAPATATNKKVTWSSDNTSVAWVDVQTGKITGTGKGTAVITATTADGGKTASCTVTVLKPVTGVSLNTQTLTLKIGATGTLTATVAPADAADKTVTWDNDAPAVVDFDPSTGKVTAVAAGTAVITVTTVDGGKTASCTVTVQKPVTGVSLDKQELTLAVGKAGTLTATVAPDDAFDTKVTWSSDTPAIARVDANTGEVTGVALGSAIITVTTADGGYTASCDVTVVVDVYAYITDAAFLAYAKAQTWDGGDGILTEAEAAVVKTIRVNNGYNGTKIASLAGIEHFTGLTWLECESNSLTLLDVSKNTALTRLYCRSNSLTSLDVKANTKLEYLSCGYNSLNGLTFDLSKNTALTELYCNNNPKMGTLNLKANTKLLVLDCAYNGLATLNVKANTELSNLDCSYNNLKGVLDISANTGLRYLTCRGIELKTLDVSKHLILKELSCDTNQLTSLNVSQNTNLEDLQCTYNQLTSLNISNNTKLYSLSCYQNQLDNLDASTMANPDTFRLYCGMQQTIAGTSSPPYRELTVTLRNEQRTRWFAIGGEVHNTTTKTIYK